MKLRRTEDLIKAIALRKARATEGFDPRPCYFLFRMLFTMPYCLLYHLTSGQIGAISINMDL